MCSNGIKESCLEAIKIPGEVIKLTRGSISTSSISKFAFYIMIGLMYLYATLKNISGRFVLCLPISINSLCNDWKGLSKMATCMHYLFNAK